MFAWIWSFEDFIGSVVTLYRYSTPPMLSPDDVWLLTRNRRVLVMSKYGKGLQPTLSVVLAMNIGNVTDYATSTVE
jgi:hypothetical protein